MDSVTARDLCALDGTLARVAKGESLLITGDDGQPIAQLVPIQRERRKREVPAPRHPVPRAGDVGLTSF